MALLDAETFQKLESLLYQHKHIERLISDRREELLIQHKGNDVNRGYRAIGATADPVGSSVARVESDDALMIMRVKKSTVARTLDYFKLTDPHKYQLIQMRYCRNWAPQTIQKKLSISQSTYQNWRLEVLNYLHKACISNGLMEF